MWRRFTAWASGTWIARKWMGAPPVEEFDTASADDDERARRVLALWEGYRKKNFMEVAEMSAQDALTAQQDDTVTTCFVDCRTEEERSVSVIPGSISKEALLQHLSCDPAWHTGKTVIVYCTIGYRSAQFTQELEHEYPDLAA